MDLHGKREIESIVEGTVLDEMHYHKYSIKYSTLFEAGIGAEAIFKLFKKLDLVLLATSLKRAREGRCCRARKAR
jgi:hypothetical protein